MGKKLKPHEINLRQKQKEILIVEISQHPNGVTTAFLAEKAGINKNLAVRLLTYMANDGLIGQDFKVRKADGSMVAHWLPDPRLGRQDNPYLRRKSTMDFKPYENSDAEQDEWTQQVKQRAAQPKFNPWGKC